MHGCHPAVTREAAHRVRSNAAGRSNTDGMRRAIRTVTGMPEPVALSDTGSGSDRFSSDSLQG